MTDFGGDDGDFKETTYYLGSNGDLECQRVVSPDDDFQMDFKEADMSHIVEEQDELQQRGSWGGKSEFIFSCLSYAVGLGNVWRFPYLCYKNGGGAFLFPYIIMLFLIGMPMLYMETCLGQYTGSGPVTAFRISPIFTGIGWAMVLTTFFASVYYCMLIAWTVFYFFASFNLELPWRHCNPASTNCVSVDLTRQMQNCSQHGGFFSMASNSTCMIEDYNSMTFDSLSSYLASNKSVEQYKLYLENHFQNASNLFNYFFAYSLNETGNYTTQLNDFLGKPHNPISPSDDYFNREVLSISDGFHDMGGPRWQLILCLFLCWIIVAACLFKGVKSAGKAVYFTALFPYLVLTILFIRAIFLPGSTRGLLFYFTPQWDKLLSPKIWGDAAVQIFYSLSPCWGGIIALSSYNKFHNDALLDTVVVVIGDGLTSIFAGMVIFSVLGYMSVIQHMPIEMVVKEGTGLAFIVYPDIVTTMPVSQLWALLFFSMLLTLGFGTMISNVNCIITGVLDRWPGVFRKTKMRSFLLLVVVCSLLFICGIPCTTRGGIYVIQILDNYSASYSVLLIGLMECVVIGWIYGVDRFLENVEEMEKRKPRLIVKIFWKYLTPLFILIICGFKLIKIERSSYGDNYTFPIVADLFGGLLSFCIILPIPALIIHHYFFDSTACRLRATSGLPWFRLLKEMAKPHHLFGPRMADNKIIGDVSSSRKASKSVFESQKALLNSQTTLASSSMNVIHQHRVA